jgi:hypothetical protein
MTGTVYTTAHAWTCPPGPGNPPAEASAADVGGLLITAESPSAGVSCAQLHPERIRALTLRQPWANDGQVHNTLELAVVLPQPAHAAGHQKLWLLPPSARESGERITRQASR